MSPRQALADLINSAERIVAFTGAGISTESGIPDFRSPTGMWAKVKPIMFQDYVASAAWRAEAWKRKFEHEHTMRAAQPNRGHRAVARLVREGKVASVMAGVKACRALRLRQGCATHPQQG